MQHRLILVVLVGLVVLAGLAFFVFQSGDKKAVPPLTTPDAAAPDPSAGSSVSPETETHAPAPYEKLVGRWRRTDGGYLIEVGGVDKDGKLMVAYYNPKPINVSRAEYAGAGDSLALFVELNDVGYPGATYRLIYEAERDLLVGLYHQPSLGQTFDVYFLRLH